jgi:hypothetical protein
LRRLFSSICVQDLYTVEQLQQLSGHKYCRAIIEENAGNPIANQKKALRVKIISGHK